MTDRPTRYGKQLTTHMSRRNGGEWDAQANTGWINLVKARADITCADDRIVIDLTAEDAEALTTFEDVIERHLVKFGLKDGLTMWWERG